jgi:hypothetical protein
MAGSKPPAFSGIVQARYYALFSTGGKTQFGAREALSRPLRRQPARRHFRRCAAPDGASTSGRPTTPPGTYRGIIWRWRWPAGSWRFGRWRCPCAPGGGGDHAVGRRIIRACHPLRNQVGDPPQRDRLERRKPPLRHRGTARPHLGKAPMGKPPMPTAGPGPRDRNPLGAKLPGHPFLPWASKPFSSPSPRSSPSVCSRWPAGAGASPATRKTPCGDFRAST